MVVMLLAAYHHPECFPGTPQSGGIEAQKKVELSKYILSRINEDLPFHDLQYQHHHVEGLERALLMFPLAGKTILHTLVGLAHLPHFHFHHSVVTSTNR